MQSVKIVACDLDETLIPSSRILNKEDIAAVQAATARGIYFVVATGRGYMTVQGTLAELGLRDALDQYVISFNGSAITENAGNRLLFLQDIRWNRANELYLYACSRGLCTHVYTEHTVYIKNINNDERRYLNNRMDYISTDEPNLDFLRDTQIIKVLYEYNSYDYLHDIERELSDMVSDMDVSYSSNRYLEFNHAGINKGAGLLHLAKLLGVDPAETMAIGDNINDLTMIKAAGVGVGVGNVDDTVRPYCDYVCHASCEEGAVAEALSLI